ncbi:MAG: acyltransferase family protein [Bacteroidetes bacterium]|nr:acyltransferase family protein [Bacteroidota bacterium]
MEKIRNEHIAWIDLLRIIACLFVLLSHSCDPFVAQGNNNYLAFLSGTFWGSFVRPCVPLFVMMSGVLLLPIKLEMSTFYSRRIKRIIIPLVFWSFALPILYYLYFNIGGTTTNLNIVKEEHTLAATLTKFYTFIFNFNYDVTPLWYLYMLIGLYFIMPIISSWLENAKQKDIKRFLWIWGISLFLPYIKFVAPALGYAGVYGNMGLLGICDWNPNGTFYYASGFIGYLVLAFYLVKFPLQWSMKKTLSIAIPLFLAGYTITSVGFVLMQKYYPTVPANLEIVWYFTGINVFMMTYAVFIVVQKIRINVSPMLTKIASLTFGIYLCHFFFLQLSFDFIIENIGFPPFLKIPILAISTFCITYPIVWVLSKFSLTRSLVM